MRHPLPAAHLRRTTTFAVAGLGLTLAVGAVAAAQPSTPPGPGAQPAPLGATVKVAPEIRTALPAGLADSVATDALRLSPETRATAPATAVRRLAGEAREVVVDVRTATTDWARGVAYIEAPAKEHAAPQGWLFVARYSDGQWVAALEGEPEFASHVASSPLVPAAERQTLKAFAERKATVTSTGTGILARTGLVLPWMVDYYMTMSGGPHAWDGGSGPWSSMDFSGGNASGIIRSSGSGTATSMCSSGGGWTRVIHPNGFSTDYYHMFSATRYNGTSIERGAYLGTTGTDLCAGGAASGAHVHWGLRTYDANMNGQYTNLNGRGIGGWTFYTGSAQYGGSATRNGVTAYPGDAIYNRLG